MQKYGVSRIYTNLLGRRIQDIFFEDCGKKRTIESIPLSRVSQIEEDLESKVFKKCKINWVY